MRFSKYAAAIASLSLFASTVASPVAAKAKQPLGLHRTPQKPPEVDKSKNKYFHEPGYASCTLICSF
jgi:hypothetical protein